ncbi:MAG: hypothetical protein N2B06_04785, partial [Clostridium sp.]
MSKIIGIDIGSKNYAICTLDDEYNIHSWDILDIIKPTCTKGVIKDATIKSLYDQLNVIIKDYDEDITQVLVERQMKQDMNFLVGASVMYFVSRGIPVKLVPSVSKLKPFIGNELKGAKNYNKRKKKA